MADKKYYALRKPTAEKVKRLISKTAEVRHPQFSLHPDDGPVFHIAYTYDGVTGRTGQTPGKGLATVKKISSDQIEDTDVEFPVEVEVYNLAVAAVGAEKYIMIAQEYMSGFWFVVWEECE